MLSELDHRNLSWKLHFAQHVENVISLPQCRAWTAISDFVRHVVSEEGMSLIRDTLLCIPHLHPQFQILSARLADQLADLCSHPPLSDVKVHERSFAFLRRHQRKPLAQPEIPEILEVAKETVRHEAVMPFVEAPSPEAALQTFPPSGLCHQAMPVRCAKPNDVEDLFPNTPITEGVFKIELTVDDKTTSITEYSWTNTKVLQLVLPSYLSLAQHVHPPHTTTYYIKVSETALCRDPPLLFHYESKHCTMLDQANMLEGLTSIIQNIVQTQSDLLQQLNFSESANAASRIQKFSQFVVHYAAAKTPEVLEQLKTNLSGLAQWQAAARREGTLFAEAFLSSIAECVERHDASAPPSLSSCKEALPINAMILAIACMAQAGVTFIPLLWCLHLQMKAQAQPVHGSSAHLQPIDPQGVTA